MKKRISKQWTGGTTDESISGRALDLIDELPCAKDCIISPLSRSLGRYRDFKKFRDTEPQPAATYAHLKATAKTIQRLLDDIRLIPSSEEALMAWRMYQAWNINYSEFENDLNEKLTRLMVLLDAISQQPASPSTKKGGGRHLEHSLLTDTATLIEGSCPSLGKLEAAGRAASILTAAGVQNMPSTPRKARDAILHILKRRNGHAP